MILRRSTVTVIALAALVALTAAGCSSWADAVVGSRPRADNAAVFDELWRQVDLHYSYFDYKAIDWDSLGTVYREQAVAARTDDALAHVLARMLAELKDVHMSLDVPGVGTLRYVAAYEMTPPDFDASATIQRYIPAAHQTSSGLTYGMLDSTVGYLRISSFRGGNWAGEVDDALEAMPAASALIVDVRSNSGGARALAIDAAGRFMDRTRTFGYLRVRNGPAHDAFSARIAETAQPAGRAHFGGPVYVLANRRAVSSAEEFVLAMRTRPNVTVVGDTTGGASGGPIARELPNGWTYEISEWMEYTPDGLIFEGIGLAPDVVVRASAGAIAAASVITMTATDAALERALSMAHKQR